MSKSHAELIREFNTKVAMAEKKAYQYPNRQRLSGTGEKRRVVTTYPFYSDNLGCDPEQEGELRAALDADNDPQCHHPEFDREGRIKVESRSHRNALLRQAGLIDKDGGYGDRHGNNS